jgi:RNA polymerase sigma-70 factor (ECF subfamily)
VLAVIYLIFNKGYFATAGDGLIRRGLCAEAIRLGRVLLALMPDEADVCALLALMLLQDSRRDARVRNDELVLLDEQDRSLWDRAAIREGVDLLERSIQLGAHRPVGIYQLQAAIAALHPQADSPDATDWAEIADLYRALQRIHDTPVVRLNRAVAIAMAQGPAPTCCVGRAIASTPPWPTNAPSPRAPMTSSVATSYGAWRKSVESRREYPALQHDGESPLAT